MKVAITPQVPEATPAGERALAHEASEFAARLLEHSRAAESCAERRRGRMMARMMDDPPGKRFTLAMADRVLRPPTACRAARLLRQLVEACGVPAYLAPGERVALELGARVSRLAPRWVMPAVTAAIRAQSAAVILPSEPEKLRPILERRRAQGMRMNLNQLGEAILGEEEAERRFQAVVARLGNPDCDYISVKISAIYSQIHLVGFEDSAAAVMERLRRIYRAAMTGGPPFKFVNLDMEEYRDLHLTVEVFRRLLDEDEFSQLEAGIVLQAYLPDSWTIQRELNEWAKSRVARGGAGIKIRVVKGANLAMEKVDAELHGWPQAPYGSKREVDANFKRMLHEACRPECAAAVRLGVASHNLFDIAYALLLRERQGVADRVEFEMLEGMANHEARTVRDIAGDMLLYAPVVRREDFHSAIAYLVRRLDENTAAGNFLRDGFGMIPGDEAWREQERRFLEACRLKNEVAEGPRRTQDRLQERPVVLEGEFANEPDTDWSLPHNVRWIRDRVEGALAEPPPWIPLVIGGGEQPGATEVSIPDPGRPGKASCRHALAGPEQVESALAAAVAARAGWQALGWDARGGLLRQAAVEIARARGEAIATMAVEAAKAIMEADAEVSEAVDFANYYAPRIESDGAELEPFGTVLVTPPWNFPFAIPCSGVLAALMAGNTVILKPAPETVRTAWVMANCLWRAGIPRDALQFLPCPDDETGRALVTDERIGAVVLTGAWETARMFLGWKPSLRLFAETSGKNALVITAAADLDLAVKDLVKGAFGHAGQKCSAASLAIVEAEVYDSPKFRQQLRDAASSLVVGPPGKFDASVTPLIREPGPELARALTQLDRGETWLLEPRRDPANPLLWSPGIKLDVSPDGWFRRTECFGPVLGLIRADDLDHAIRIQNDSQFGLTGGIHSLDPEEIEIWKERVEVGNAYVNRPITGAIVRRQPFGGWKRSCFGPGAKAGGPNYVAQFGVWRNRGLPGLRREPDAATADLLARLVERLPHAAVELKAAAGSDAWRREREFGIEHDPSGLRCEWNVFRYRRFDAGIIRATRELVDEDLARLLLVARAIGTEISISLDEPRPWLDGLGFPMNSETEEQLASRLAAGGGGGGALLRSPGGSPSLKLATLSAGWRWADAPVVWNARLEWPAWLREQAVSETRHRYGNLEPTAPVASPR